MHDTRFLSQLILPPATNAQSVYAPIWSESFYVNPAHYPGPIYHHPTHYNKQMSRPRHAGRPGASTRRRHPQQSLGRHNYQRSSVKYHQQSLGRRYQQSQGRRHQHSLARYALHRGLVAPSLRRTLRKSPYDHALHQPTLSPTHLTTKPRNWRSTYNSPSKGGFASYLKKMGSFLPSKPDFSSYFLLVCSLSSFFQEVLHFPELVSMPPYHTEVVNQLVCTMIFAQTR